MQAVEKLGTRGPGRACAGPCLQYIPLGAGGEQEGSLKQAVQTVGRASVHAGGLPLRGGVFDSGRQHVQPCNGCDGGRGAEARRLPCMVLVAQRRPCGAAHLEAHLRSAHSASGAGERGVTGSTDPRCIFRRTRLLISKCIDICRSSTPMSLSIKRASLVNLLRIAQGRR